MPSVCVITGSLLLAAVLIALAWAMQRRRSRTGAPCDSSEAEAVVAFLPPID